MPRSYHIVGAMSYRHREKKAIHLMRNFTLVQYVHADADEAWAGVDDEGRADLAGDE